MERKITYNGKLTKISELNLPQELWDKIYEGFYTATNLKQFGQDLGFSERAITILFEDYLDKLQKEKVPYITDSLPIETIIGAKTVPYFETEDEILKDLNCNYTWEELTLREQQFYLNYEKPIRKRCFLRKRDEASDSQSDRI